ncbi:NuoM family protein [Klenkia sp. PcliD-1-E]|uniref:complex I subunit 4 family protein n=1 Tax=Klenkia sp. PcliD-1-E TaxID=2954492 RepID=UPI002096F993|nr:NADH-quinone oxidoreductase subunit M [Klenkia sp. PcliD-1-E]MCO7218323.1 NADH-quinone oxidoreductase subunit M [Klenkia sp. PcliD-1-E]
MNVLELVVFAPLLAAGLLAVLPVGDRAARWTWVLVTAADLALLVALALAYRTPPAGGLAFERQLSWIPSVGVGYHVGVDGLSLPLLLLTGVVFAACAVHALREQRRPRAQAALFLFLQTACLGVFVAQDLVLFFVFFDLTIVGMWFSIAGWGHGDNRRSALQFFLYTFLGSLALLAGFIGLYVAADPHTFDIPALVAAAPLADHPVGGAVVLGLVLLGLAIKTPLVPFHTWLPPAHTDAPAIGSAVLAAVLLKLGTYGFVRIAMPVLPQAWQAWAWVVLSVGVVSVLYGGLVALAQTDLKRLVAYTSVTHMGYVAVAVGVAGLAGGDAVLRQVAATGAVTQMVSHGLLTGALFLLAGALHDRRGSYALADYGGLARPAPRFAVLFGIAAFGSLGLPGFSGFVAEFQVLSGSIGVTAWALAAVPGILLTAVLLVRATGSLLTGPTVGRAVGFTDLRVHEVAPVAGLLALSVLVGLLPGPLLAWITPAAQSLVVLVGR